MGTSCELADPVVDEDALVEGEIARAALDVMAEEPLLDRQDLDRQDRELRVSG